MSTPPSNYVLLANARFDKGYDLFLAVAARLPDIQFLAIASQSNLAEPTAAHEALGLRNVTIVPQVEDMRRLYQGARAVVVPSYRFRESFSRVAVEAQRLGKPVIGAAAGNLPNLLRDSGIVLPEDADRWAEEIRRLYTDAGYYGARVQSARANAERFTVDGQRGALASMVGAIDEPMLIGVGSGIGNMLHATPMIRNISRRLGKRVDVVVSDEYQGGLFLMHNRAYVNAVYGLRQTVLARRYHTIFVTHCFGGARVPFRAERVIWSRERDQFRAGMTHETLFNLESARALLGIPYDDDDALGYYVGDFTYRPPAEPLIGIHAGSKTGHWASKRWPLFGPLAERLTRRGLRVASFGTPDEYVEGTENRTGGTIREMCQAMLDCSFFVANDSGVMNIANALGIPLLAIFGPTDAKTRLPLRPTSAAIALDKECAPCELKNHSRFISGECRCIAEISLDAVARRLDGLLQAPAQDRIAFAR